MGDADSRSSTWPKFSVADVHRGWTSALSQAGAEVYDWPFDAALEWYERACKSFDGMTTSDAVQLATRTVERMCYRFWPDVVLITSGFYLPLETLDIIRSRGHKIVMLHTESPYEDDRQVARAAHADLNILNDPTNIDRFPTGTIYLPHCYDPARHHPGKSTTPSDVAIVGTGYPSRIDFLEAVDWQDWDVLLAGNWQILEGRGSTLEPYVGHKLDECLPNDMAADLYRGTKASVNLYRREAEHDGLVEGWAMGPREVELAACGTFYLTEERGENREVLPMVPTFSSPADFGDKLAWWLAHPDERAEVARKARAAVAGRTFVDNARRLLQLIV